MKELQVDDDQIQLKGCYNGALLLEEEVVLKVSKQHGVQIGVTLRHAPNPETVTTGLDGWVTPNHMEGLVCWLDAPAYAGTMWSVAYKKDDWESRARRTWHD